MARLDLYGLDSVLRDMNRLQARTGPVAEEMVRKGAEIMAEYRKREAEKRGLKAPGSGAMIKNIRPTKRIKNVAGALELAVYSQGKDPKSRTGQTNAAKEFLDHYGYKSRSASHWVESAEKAGEKPAEEAMEKIWDEFIHSPED